MRARRAEGRWATPPPAWTVQTCIRASPLYRRRSAPFDLATFPRMPRGPVAPGRGVCARDWRPHAPTGAPTPSEIEDARSGSFAAEECSVPTALSPGDSKDDTQSLGSTGNSLPPRAISSIRPSRSPPGRCRCARSSFHPRHALLSQQTAHVVPKILYESSPQIEIVPRDPIATVAVVSSCPPVCDFRAGPLPIDGK